MASRIASTSKAVWPPLQQCLRCRRFATAADEQPSPSTSLIHPPPLEGGYVRIRPFKPPKESPQGWLLRREGEDEAAYRWRLAWSGSGVQRPPPAPEHAELDLTPRVPWKPQVKRVGAIGKKLGMLTMWDINGQKMAVTVFRLENNYVCNSERFDGHARVWVSSGLARPRDMAPSERKQCEAFGVPYAKAIHSFKCHVDGCPPTHSMIRAIHFVPGQYVDICGQSKDKGVQGVMKRWGFQGGPASHGSSKFHRRGGSIAPRGLGRIWKGTKMAGHMGGLNRTRTALVLRIDTELDLIFVKGPTPGPVGGYLDLHDSVRRPPRANRNKHQIAGLPFPAGTLELQRRLGDVPKEITLLEFGTTKDPLNEQGL